MARNYDLWRGSSWQTSSLPQRDCVYWLQSGQRLVLRHDAYIAFNQLLLRLKDRYLTGSGSQPGVPPRGHLKMSRGIFVCHNLGQGCWKWVEARDAAKRRTTHRTAPITNNYLILNYLVSKSPLLGVTWFDCWTFFWREKKEGIFRPWFSFFSSKGIFWDHFISTVILMKLK